MTFDTIFTPASEEDLQCPDGVDWQNTVVDTVKFNYYLKAYSDDLGLTIDERWGSQYITR